MRFLVRRLGHGAGVVLGVSILVFALTWLRGDPAAVLVPLDTPPAEMARLRNSLGLDRPAPVQYLTFLTRAVQGDFGDSRRFRTPVLPLVLERLPATLRLVAAALALAILVAVPLGIGAGLHPQGPLDLAARTAALFGQSLAVPWIGLILIWLFAVQLQWLPSSGAGRPEAIILPAIVIALYPAAGLIRLLRAGLLDTMTADYIRTARAKGLPGAAVLTRHAIRNAARPSVTFLGLQIAFLFGNSVVAESVFAYPGLGRLAVDAIAARDTPLIQAIVAVAAVVVVLTSLVVDLCYAWLDPRVRLA